MIQPNNFCVSAMREKHHVYSLPKVQSLALGINHSGAKCYTASLHACVSPLARRQRATP